MPAAPARPAVSDGGSQAASGRAKPNLTAREIEVLRGDFAQVLYDDTAGSVEYVFGDRIAGLTQDADGVDVTGESYAPMEVTLEEGGK